jgi:hypothetical protein
MDFSVTTLVPTTPGYISLTSLIGDALGLSAVQVNRVLPNLSRDGLVTPRAASLDVLDLSGLAPPCDFGLSYVHLGRGA